MVLVSVQTPRVHNVLSGALAAGSGLVHATNQGSGGKGQQEETCDWAHEICFHSTTI
jgi:hypothetical protein